jgi:hypothetical protein
VTKPLHVTPSQARRLERNLAGQGKAKKQKQGNSGGREIMKFTQYVHKHIGWSLSTFGEGERAEGLCRHIEKELNEIRAKPSDLMEWIDVIILALDGAWRSGHTPEQIAAALIAKQRINFNRQWKRADDAPTEHVRETK